ncbi:hypothetical protein H2201_009312, partial [Coniosporium apollinis]
MAFHESPPIDLDSDDNAMRTEPGTAEIETPQASDDDANQDPLSNTKKRKARSVTCVDMWAEARQPRSSEPKKNQYGQKWFYCKRCSFKQTAHNRIREHLAKRNIIVVQNLSAKKVAIEASISGLFGKQKARQE